MDDEHFASGPLFLYGIVDGSVHADAARRVVRDRAGVNGHPVHVVDSHGLAVLVSPVASPDAFRRPDADVRRAHRSVVDAVSDAGTILPFRAGTVVDSGEALAARVASDVETYRARLADLDGHVQIDVRLTLPAMDAPPALEMSGPAYRADRPGTAYLLARQRKADQDAARGRHAARSYRDALDALAVETQVDRAPDDARVLTLAYLVRRDAVDAFRRAARRVRTPGVRDVDIVGPGAAVAFV